jgi:membrane-bound serine protease (ClpP class)
MKVWRVLILSLFTLGAGGNSTNQSSPAGKRVFIIPIRDDIMPPMVYLVRRGVKEAMDKKADLLVLDMETNGGRVDATEEIMRIIDKFKGPTVTYVNRKAFSAGSFISAATQKIYMAPQSVIGAAAPIFLAPGGGGPENMPDTMEVKAVSALRGLVRTEAEKNGHNPDVFEAMIDKTREFKLDGEVLNEKGQILTLTDVQAAKKYGNPPKPLLSAGTVESLDALLKELGFVNAEQHQIEQTGAEKLGTWLNAISPLLLLIGIIGIYIEFKTPGFGLPGIIGIAAFALYFLGGYAAGLSGLEWVLIFLLGLTLVAIEFFVYPGTIALGLIGASLMLVALIMALVDVYPNPSGLPSLPSFTWDTFRRPIEVLSIATLGAIVAIVLLSRLLPKTSIYRTLVSESASGVVTEAVVEQQKVARQGQMGVAISTLRPGGKAQFGDQILDVISQGDMIAKGTRVRIIGSSGREAIVEAVV